MDEGRISRLIRNLTSDEAKVHNSAVDEVNARAPDDRAAVPILLKYLRDPDPRVRTASGRHDFPSDRAAAAWILGRIGRFAGPAIDDLGRILKNPEEMEKARGWCAWALRRIGTRAIPILVEALQNPDTAGRVLAARGLRDFGTKGAPAVRALIAALGDPEVDVRGAAMDALKEIGPPAVPGLTQALTNPGPWIQYGAAAAILKEEPSHAAAAAVLIRCLKHENHEIRAKAANSLLLEAGGHERLTVPDYIALLGNEVREVRQFAAAALRNIGPPWTLEAMPDLIAALDDQYGADVYAIQALGDMRELAVPAIPKLIEHLKREEPAAAEALGRIGPAAAEALPALKDIAGGLQDIYERMEEARRAGEELEMYDGEILATRVMQAMEAIQGRLVIPAAVPFVWATIPELIEALQSGNPTHVAAASRRLVRGGGAAVPALAELLSHSDKNVQAGALAALRELGPRAAPAIPAVIEGLGDRERYMSDTPMRDLYVLTLAAIGEPAIPALEEASKTAEPGIRSCAREALRQIREDLSE
jgi:HEAT repeat protein